MTFDELLKSRTGIPAMQVKTKRPNSGTSSKESKKRKDNLDFDRELQRIEQEFLGYEKA